MIEHSIKDRVESTSAQQQLLRLNIDFLWLLGHASRLPPTINHAARQRPHLPSSHANNFAQCDDLALQRMASCEFSLFSLSLHRIDTWQGIVAHTRTLATERRYEAMTVATTANQSQHNMSMCFMECALFFAWHLAQYAPLSARLMLGIADECIDLIAALEPWQCRHIAKTHSKLLSPRWPRHPFFWSDLWQYGRSGAAQQYKLLCALGTQLLAHDLEPSALLRLTKVASLA